MIHTPGLPLFAVVLLTGCATPTAPPPIRTYPLIVAGDFQAKSDVADIAPQPGAQIAWFRSNPLLSSTHPQWNGENSGADIPAAKGAAQESRTTEGRRQAVIWFDTDSHELDEGDRRLLALIARRGERIQRIRIEGDADPRGDLSHNRTLASSRAQAVARFLTGVGIPDTRITTHTREQTGQPIAGEADATRRRTLLTVTEDP